MDALLQAYKDQYPNVFAIDIKDQQFILRELTRKEYKRIVDRTYGNDYGLEEMICQTAVLYPEGYDFTIKGRAGFAKTLAAEVIAISGFAHPDQQVEILDYYRADMMNLDSQAETVIQLVFPGVSEEEMQDWTQEMFMRRLARAEWVMREIWGMPHTFARRDQAQEGEPEVEPPTLKEIGTEIREQGGDPMFALKDMIVKKRDAGYVQFPIIGGTKLLENEEVLGYVREQIQRLSEQ